VRRDLPTYRELIYPTLRAVASLGGSAQGAEITDALTELLEVTPEQLAVTYDGRPKSVLIDRMDWARSYAKLAGALDSPRRGLFDTHQPRQTHPLAPREGRASPGGAARPRCPRRTASPGISRFPRRACRTRRGRDRYRSQHRGGRFLERGAARTVAPSRGAGTIRPGISTKGWAAGQGGHVPAVVLAGWSRFGSTGR
jgi:Mrr N-terminal domain